MSELTYKFITELDEVESLSSTDYFLITRIGIDSDAVSKKVEYSALCSTFLNEIKDSISSMIDECVEDLSTIVIINRNNISVLSDTLDDSVSAIIKMANCIQTNKANISAISVGFNHISGIDGIVVRHKDRIQDGLTIGHENSIISNLNPQLLKIKYNNYGHIIEKSSVLSSDITSIIDINSMISERLKILSTFLSSATNGLKAKGNVVSLLTATTNVIGGVKINGNNMSIDSNGVISARDTTYGIAGSNTLGLVKINSSAKFDNQKNYPVQLSNGLAYVNVPWESGELTDDNEYTLTKYQTISSIEVDHGVLQTPGKSTFIYDSLSSLSSDVYNLNIPKLSNDYVGFNKEGNTTAKFVVNGTTLKLYTKSNTTIPVASYNLQSILGDQIDEMSVVHYKESEEGEKSDYGLYIRTTFKDSTAEDNIYCNLSGLNATCLSMSTIDSNSIYDTLITISSMIKSELTRLNLIV